MNEFSYILLAFFLMVGALSVGVVTYRSARDQYGMSPMGALGAAALLIFLLFVSMPLCLVSALTL